MGFRDISQLLNVSAADQEDARRRKLLNIILFGVGSLALLILLMTLMADLTNLVVGNVLTIYLAVLAFLSITVLIYFINRKVAGPLASLLFLLLFTAILPFSDTPAEVADGQSLFVFTIPIIMSSVLLRPYASFLFALLSSLLVSLVAFSIPIVPNLPAIGGYFMVALISWLSARSLEVALHQLVLVNRDLDLRVALRTKELSAALSRERMEAGKNQAILHGIADGVLVFDLSNRAIVANPAAEQLLEHPMHQILNQDAGWILEQGRLSTREQQQVLDLLANPAPDSGNVRIQWGARTLAVNAAPVRAPAGEVIGRVAVFRDFTREAEVDRMKSGFVAMVSHELRTPLSSILGYSEMLREGMYGAMNDPQMNATERIIANTRRLLTIVNDLLDQAQIEAGKLVFHIGNFRPNELIDHMKSVMEHIIGQKQLTLNISIAEDLPATLLGDVQRINQVLVNLVNNAVKFTDSGEISVRLFRCDAHYWAIEVADSGVGIPLEAQAYIFDPFRQVNMDVTRQYGGIGLGLSIVKRLVTLMHGEIRVRSVVDQGSTFTVILPFEPVNSAQVDKEYEG